MRAKDAFVLADYWGDAPPEHETLAMLAAAFTSWEPASRRNMSEEERAAEHRKSLEARWQAGAMNVKQMFELYGARAVSVGDGTHPYSQLQSTGVGVWPPKF